MKALNLDDLVADKRTVTLFGKEHEVVDMSVENYLQTVKASKEMTDETPVDEAMEASIKVVLMCIPTLDAETLKRLSLKQLGAIIKFSRGGYDDEATEVAEEKKPVVKAKKAK